jgi:hypothetical protein
VQGHPALGAGLGLTVPNPAVGRITFEVDLPQMSSVRVSLIDVSGKFIKTVMTEPMPAGRHALSFARISESGQRLAAGVYYLRLEANGAKVTRKVVVVQ